MTPLVELVRLPALWGLDALGLALLIGLGIMGVTFAGLDLADLSQALSWAPSPPAVVRVKLLLLAALFFIGFMHFVSSLRYHNQGGFVINLPDGFFNGSAIDSIADTLNRAGDHYNQGTRVFILAAPCVLWLIGPDWFLGGVLVALLLPSPGPSARFITRLPGKWAGEPASRFELHYLKASHPH